MKWGLFAAVASTLGVAFYVGHNRPAHSGNKADADSNRGTVSTEVESAEDAVFNHHAWFVVDRKANRIHVLDSTGKRVKSFGREGRGPGEFRRPLFIASAGDRVYVAELTIPDVSVFDTAGVFIKRLSPEKPCGPSGIVAMNASGDELFTLRRCFDAARVRYQIEHSVGDRLVLWDRLADTAALSKSGLPPLTFPLFAVDSTRVALGIGDEQCLTVVRRTDGTREPVRCLTEIPRLRMPDAEHAELVARFGKRLAVPDSLPRAKRILLLDSLLFIQSVAGSESTIWKVLRIDGRGSGPRAIGRNGSSHTFLSPDGLVQLSTWDDVEGIRAEVIRVTH